MESLVVLIIPRGEFLPVLGSYQYCDISPNTVIFVEGYVVVYVGDQLSCSRSSYIFALVQRALMESPVEDANRMLLSPFSKMIFRFCSCSQGGFQFS